MDNSNLKRSSRVTMFIFVIVALLLSQVGSVSALSAGKSADQQLGDYAIVFVSRKIPNRGTVYMKPNETGSQPGVGPYSRFQVAAPGKLIVREADGTLRTLIDGSAPTPQSLNLIDVNAPDVSYDATKIVFAGLVAGLYDTAPDNDPNAWRLYTINVDGTGLQQITFSDQDNLDFSQFGSNADHINKYDDTDPAWLPDGRIVFSSTRWPSHAHYGGVRTSNLYVVNADGSGLHRITSERNGADRPLVDPITGKIVYSRWWRNFHFAVNSMQTIYVNKSKPGDGYYLFNGLSADRNNQLVRPDYLWRNSWHAATINPDGTGLGLWTGSFRSDPDNHVYGGAFTPEGDLIANFFPMTNMTEAAGFGTIRLYHRGPGKYMPINGVSGTFTQYVRSSKPVSYGVFVGPYATEPAVLPDGRIIISWAPDHKQDYGLYIVNKDGSGRTLIYDNPGTTELRAHVITPRPLPPIIPDTIIQTPSLLPPTQDGPYDQDGTFTFDALNVYTNAPVDTDIVSAPAVGSAAKIRFFTDFQRTAFLASSVQDWPILLDELVINPDGSVSNPNAPANLPLFEQIRSADGTVPLTGGPTPDGAAHVTGLNFGRPGDTQRCVGCHTGHTMIPVPDNPEDAKWTNLAPGAVVSASSTETYLPNANGLIDRKVHMVVPNKSLKYWYSQVGQSPTSQWVQLTFPVPITVRTVRLYNIPAADSTIRVQDTTVRLFSDAEATQEVANQSSGAVSENGTDVSFNEVLAKSIRIEFKSVSGGNVAGLAEVEVIARGEKQDTPPVKPGTPKLFWPATGAVASSLKPMLDWMEISPFAAYYQLQVSSNSTFTALVLDQSNIIPSQFTLKTDLITGRSYFWRVRGFNDAGTASAWSATWNFKTPLGLPSLTSPVQNQSLLTDRPSFDWSDVTNATGYNIQASTSSSFGSLLLNASSPTSDYVMTKSLPQNKLIFWRVRAKNAAVTGNWSAVWVFRSGIPPSVPVLSSPTSGSLVTDYTPLLQWKVVAVPSGTSFARYQLQLDDTSDFSSPLLDKNLTNLNSPRFELTTNLTPNAKYYWRIRSFNTLGHYSAWSNVFNFRTAVLPPSLSAPNNNTTVGSLRPIFDWTDVTGATGYSIQISTTSSFSTLLVNGNTVASTYQPGSNLPAGKILYWRVRAKAANGPSDWSPVFSFTTP